MATSYEDHVAAHESLPEDLRDAFYDRMKHTVVMIQSPIHGTDKFMYGGGFGVEAGLILTAFHVIGKKAKNVEYKCYGETMYNPADIVHTDSTRDLALLRPAILSTNKAGDGMPPDAIQYVNFCPSELMRVGMQVISISHPSSLIYSCTFGEIAYPANDVKSGRKMGTCRTLEDRNLLDLQTALDVLQINNVHGVHGSSGCPIFNGAGLVVGMTIFIKDGFDFIVHASTLVTFIAAAGKGKTRSLKRGYTKTVKRQKTGNEGKVKATLISRTKERESEKMIVVGENEKAIRSRGGKKQQSVGSCFSKKHSKNAIPKFSFLPVLDDSHHDPDNACAANCSKHNACQSKYSGHMQNSYPKVPSSPLHSLPGLATVTSTINNVFRTPFLVTATKKSLQYTSVERIPEAKIKNFTMQKETKPVTYVQRKLEVTLDTVSKPSNCATKKKYALSSPSLKRMILEESKTDPESFNPSECVMESTKRGGLLQVSPTINKKLEVAPTINKKLEVSPKVDNNLVSGTGNLDAYQGNVSMDTSAYSNSETVADLELPLLIENDRNVEKAEACAREHNDICNMLTRENDEAKELLVSSIINSTALMMLNQPTYDEKISFRNNNPSFCFLFSFYWIWNLWFLHSFKHLLPRNLQKKFTSLNSWE